MKKRLVIFAITLTMLFTNLLPVSAGLNVVPFPDNENYLDGIDWDSLDTDYVVQLSSVSQTIKVGEQIQLLVRVISESQGEVSDVEIEWSSSHPEIATVTDKGVITGIAPGTSHVSATVVGRTLSCAVIVEAIQDGSANPPAEGDKPGDSEKPDGNEKPGDVGNIDGPTQKLTIKSVTLSKTRYTYNGKVQTPSIKVVGSNGKTLAEKKDYTVAYSSGRKNVGTYAVTVTFKGDYSDNAKIVKNYDIVSKGTSVKKLSAGKKKITITWKKQTKQVNGYQIQCSLKKTFKKVATVNISGKKKTKVTLTGLKAKKKYFIRIRT